MSRDYKVNQGDCILSIAKNEGFFWKTIWEFGENSALKEKREDPNLLFPGDVVIIPDKTPKSESAATDQRHRYLKKGTPGKFRLFIEKGGAAVKNVDYLMNVDGKLIQGKTDSRGFIEIWIEPDAQSAHLEIDGLTYDLEFGSMDPLDEIVGVQARLQNLGFYNGPLDGNMGQDLRNAIAEFQSFANIEATGELNEETQQKLHERHDKDHDQAEPEDSASTAPDEPADDSPAVDAAGSEVGEEESEGDADTDTGTEVNVEIPADLSDSFQKG